MTLAKPETKNCKRGQNQQGPDEEKIAVVFGVSGRCATDRGPVDDGDNLKQAFRAQPVFSPDDDTIVPRLLVLVTRGNLTRRG